MKLDKNLGIGFIVGALSAFVIIALFQAVRTHGQPEVLARMGAEVLTEQALRAKVGDYLVPLENDQYAVRQWGIEDWVQRRLLEKEAKAKGVNVDELLRSEVWSKVKVSYEDARVYYSKNKEIFKKPFAAIHALVAKQLRQTEYARLKEEYLLQLKEKYGVQTFLKKPDTYVEGLALAPQPPTTETVAPAPVPSAAAGARSAIGSSPAKGPENAKITLVEFADFHCGFCKRVKPTLEQLLNKYPGQIRWIFRHFPLSKTPGAGSYLTHEASVCAQEQGKFWEYHDAIFAANSISQESDLLALARDVGLNTAQFQDCLKSGKHRSLIEADLAEGAARGVQGTPIVFINDVIVAGAYPLEHFVNVIEGVLDPRKKKVPAPATVSPPAPTKPVQFKDLEGRPSLGPRDAAVTLVEFSDFYCPFCKRVTPALEQLAGNYPGKIRRVWRHYPLAFHTGADRVHEASECAHEQEKFWPYHHELFKRQGTAFDDEALIKLAKDLDLNKKKFEKCLQSGKYKELIQKEIAGGNEAGVQGTPAVFVNGKLVAGAQPYENFDRIVKDQLGNS